MTMVTLMQYYRFFGEFFQGRLIYAGDIGPFRWVKGVKGWADYEVSCAQM